eukprot:m.312655 g.312655  ORF g.312655 m.312655 type:complete len:547 (-) comp30887_c0_seq1:86-1726(-)
MAAPNCAVQCAQPQCRLIRLLPLQAPLVLLILSAGGTAAATTAAPVTTTTAPSTDDSSGFPTLSAGMVMGLLVVGMISVAAVIVAMLLARCGSNADDDDADDGDIESGTASKKTKKKKKRAKKAKSKRNKKSNRGENDDDDDDEGNDDAARRSKLLADFAEEDFGASGGSSPSPAPRRMRIPSRSQAELGLRTVRVPQEQDTLPADAVVIPMPGSPLGPHKQQAPPHRWAQLRATHRVTRSLRRQVQDKDATAFAAAPAAGSSGSRAELFQGGRHNIRVAVTDDDDDGTRSTVPGSPLSRRRKTGLFDQDSHSMTLRSTDSQVRARRRSSRRVSVVVARTPSKVKLATPVSAISGDSGTDDTASEASSAISRGSSSGVSGKRRGRLSVAPRRGRRSTDLWSHTMKHLRKQFKLQVDKSGEFVLAPRDKHGNLLDARTEAQRVEADHFAKLGEQLTREDTLLRSASYLSEKFLADYNSQQAVLERKRILDRERHNQTLREKLKMRRRRKVQPMATNNPSPHHQHHPLATAEYPASLTSTGRSVIEIE